ncbi:MAG: neutral zinc metallopeptidase [Pseudomonadota bacterium]
MRYGRDDRESSNVEDRRGRGGGFRLPGGFGGRGRRIRLPMGGGRGGGFSITTLLIIGAIMLLFGFNPLDLLRGNFSGGGGGAPDYSQVPQLPRNDGGARTGSGRTGSPFQLPGGSGQAQVPPGNDELATFTKRVLADTEDVWNRVFQQMGRRYEEPKLVIFSGATSTGCGMGQSAMGPFYCPLDRKIYIDLKFYRDLKQRFKAPGDFAQAYVIAHEVGHHIQLLLGIAQRVQEMKRRVSKTQSNAIQVRMELQADCIAGVWANLNDQLKNRLEQGDIQEGLNAASAIGDDMIQRRTTGRVVPDAFTHGSSEQRVRWFRRGFDSGRLQDCDTFNAQRI